MRIGIDAWYLSKPYSSIGKMLINTLRLWKRNKKGNVEIVLFGMDNPYIKGYQNDFDVVIIPTRNILKFYWKLNKKAKEEQIDLLFFPFDVAPFYSENYALMVHDLIFLKLERNLKNLFFSVLVRNAVKKAKVIITPSKFTKEEVVETYKIEGKKVQELHLGIDPTFRKVSIQEAVDRIYGLDLLPHKVIDNGFILYVGRIKPAYKNMNKLLRAYVGCKDIIKKYLVIVSTDKPSKADKKIIMKFKDDIILLHSIPEDMLVLLYNLSDFFVYPSLYEGFGLSVIEAMACGKPLIVSDIPPFREVVGDAGIFFNPLDINSLREAMINLSMDKSLREGLSKKAEERAKIFTWENFSEKLLGILISCAEDR